MKNTDALSTGNRQVTVYDVVQLCLWGVGDNQETSKL